MMTLSDRYGDLDIEEVDDFEGLEPDNESEINFENTFQRGEVRSFETDFGYQLDAAISDMDEEDQDPRWSDEFDDQNVIQEFLREAE